MLGMLIYTWALTLVLVMHTGRVGYVGIPISYSSPGHAHRQGYVGIHMGTVLVMAGLC